LRKLAGYGSKDIIFLLLMFGCFNNASTQPTQKPDISFRH
jgi:hypothetical protein